MTREEFYVLAKGMKAVYTYDRFLPDNAALEIWYGLLRDLPYKVASAAVKQHMQTSPRVPTPADIRALAASITAGPELNDMEAWGLVSRAIRRSGYNSKEEFEKLPETVQRAVGSPEQLYVWSQTETTSVETVIQSQFLRTYRTEVKRKEDRKMMSGDLLALIDGTVKQIEGGNNVSTVHSKSVAGKEACDQ